jgi:hypothetical protein
MKFHPVKAEYFHMGLRRSEHSVFANFRTRLDPTFCAHGVFLSSEHLTTGHRAILPLGNIN